MITKVIVVSVLLFPVLGKREVAESHLEPETEGSQQTATHNAKVRRKFENNAQLSMPLGNRTAALQLQPALSEPQALLDMLSVRQPGGEDQNKQWQEHDEEEDEEQNMEEDEDHDPEDQDMGLEEDDEEEDDAKNCEEDNQKTRIDWEGHDWKAYTKQQFLVGYQQQDEATSGEKLTEEQIADLEAEVEETWNELGEKRIDTDGNQYTFKEFLCEYGPETVDLESAGTLAEADRKEVLEQWDLAKCPKDDEKDDQVIRIDWTVDPFWRGTKEHFDSEQIDSELTWEDLGQWRIDESDYSYTFREFLCYYGPSEGMDSVLNRWNEAEVDESDEPGNRWKRAGKNISAALAFKKAGVKKTAETGELDNKTGHHPQEEISEEHPVNEVQQHKETIDHHEGEQVEDNHDVELVDQVQETTGTSKAVVHEAEGVKKSDEVTDSDPNKRTGDKDKKKDKKKRDKKKKDKKKDKKKKKKRKKRVDEGPDDDESDNESANVSSTSIHTEFVRKQDCKGGWTPTIIEEGSQSSLQACAEFCASQGENVEYVAFRPIKPVYKPPRRTEIPSSCACFSNGCPNDDEHNDYTAYRIIRI